MDKMKESFRETKKTHFQEDSLILGKVALPYYEKTAFD